ncbi:hypothetical protein [Aromatoleum sp.]|uniref:hypothetical protein n=1 Tax=Aromatoleum sp. TaxID=2307007 RepID=UPI002FC8F41B
MGDIDVAALALAVFGGQPVAAPERDLRLVISALPRAVETNDGMTTRIARWKSYSSRARPPRPGGER